MSAAPATGISVLIRTFNSGKTLEEVLAGLPLAEGDEFVVVDSGSTDDTLAIAKRHGARVIQPAGPFNYSKSLNLGFAAARNPWVLVLSSHCIPGSAGMLGLLRQTASEAAAPVAVIYGQSDFCKPSDAAAALDYIDQACWERNRLWRVGNAWPSTGGLAGRSILLRKTWSRPRTWSGSSGPCGEVTSLFPGAAGLGALPKPGEPALHVPQGVVRSD